VKWAREVGRAPVQVMASPEGHNTRSARPTERNRVLICQVSTARPCRGVVTPCNTALRAATEQATSNAHPAVHAPPGGWLRCCTGEGQALLLALSRMSYSPHSTGSLAARRHHTLLSGETIGVCTTAPACACHARQAFPYLSAAVRCARVAMWCV
jgi:hypothetical protein